MTREVILSSIAKKKLELLFDYLEKEFSEKTKLGFISKLEKTVGRITQYPESFPKSSKEKSVYRCVINRYTVMFYRFNKERIEILTFFDNRMDPAKSPY
ncbi:MAG: type II toxin-antitoxin system RelE/ParE family toxin [Bacteroidia bacterium]